MITYLVGDATKPVGEGNKIICHVCNDCGGWGSGFVLAISRMWKQPEDSYRAWYKKGFSLGEVSVVPVEPGIFVANMIAQHRFGYDGVPPIRYDALKTCLISLAQQAVLVNASVHMPRIGCGLAGGSWAEVETIVKETLVNSGISVFVYDLPCT